MGRRVRWFSEGGASAVAVKLDILEFGAAAGPVVTCRTGAEDEDNARFSRECEKWFGCAITVIGSEKYADTWDVWQRRGYMSGINGAPCTTELKIVPRMDYCLPSDIHVFGYTADPLDIARAARLRQNYPLMTVETPLIDRITTKEGCLELLMRAGIDPPRTYAMGFPNANCLKSGCSKAQSPDYWALHRKHFPEGFARTAAIARHLGVKLVIVRREKQPDGKYKNIRGFIDEIPLDQPTSNPIAPRCDLLCAITQSELEAV